MKDVVIIGSASQIGGTMVQYIQQLSAAGIELYIRDISSAPWLNRGGFISERIAAIREHVQRFANYQYIIFSDCHDVTFYGNKDMLMARMPKEHVLHAAEKNCYPDSGLISQIPDRGPWRFANGGLCAGSPEAFWKWCDAAISHPKYQPEILDQHFLNLLLADKSPLCEIDHQTKLFFCLYGGYDELGFVGGSLMNRLYDTWPLFIHANGKWSAEDAFRRRAESLHEGEPLYDRRT